MLLHGIDVPKIYHDNFLLKDVLDYTVDDQFDVILMNPPYGGNEKPEIKNHFPADLSQVVRQQTCFVCYHVSIKKEWSCSGYLTGWIFVQYSNCQGCH